MPSRHLAALWRALLARVSKGASRGAQRRGDAKTARGRRWWLAILPVGAALALGAWGIHRALTATEAAPTPPPGAASSATSLPRPTAPSLVDEQFRFKLEAPSADDRLRGPLEANRLHPNGIAALSLANGCLLVVSAEYLPGAKLEDVVDTAIADLRFANKKTTARGPARRDEVDGVAYTVEADSGGEKSTTHGFIAERDGWFESTSWAEQWGVGCESVERAFHFLPGKVEGRPTDRPTPDEANPIYRLRGGVFESPFYGFRVAPPAGAALVAGKEAVAPGAQVGVLANGYVAFVDAAPRTAIPVERLISAHVPGGKLPETSAPLDVAGESVATYRFDTPGPRDLLFASVERGDKMLFFRVLHAPALEPDAPRFLRSIIEGTTLLDAASAEQVQRELPEVDARVELGRGRVVRGRRFRDFELELELELPESPFVTSFGRADGDADGVRLALLRAGGVLGTTVLVRDPGVDVQKAQVALIQEMTGATEIPKHIVTESASPNPDARRSTLELTDPRGDAFAIVVDTFPGKGQTLHVATIGPAREVRSEASATDAMVKSLRLGALPETELRGGQVANHRFGFRMELPKTGWKSEVLPGSGGTVVGFALRSERAGVEVTGYARLPAEMEFFQTFLEQRFVGAASKLGPPERREHTVDGLPATRLSWPAREDVVVFRDGAVLYTIRVQLGDPGFDPEGIYQAWKRE